MKAFSTFSAIVACIPCLSCGPATTLDDEQPAQVQERLDAEHFVIRLPGAQVDQLALVATHRLFIGDGADVRKTNGRYGTVALVGMGTVHIGLGAQVGDVLSGGRTILRGARVHGNVQSAGPILRDRAIVDGSIRRGPFQTTRVEWQAARPTDTQGNATAARGETVELGAGRFDRGAVESDAVLSLTSGSYYFDSLVTEPRGTISIDDRYGPVTVYVESQWTHKGAVVGLSQPGNLTIVYQGDSAAELGADFAGTLVAPRALVRLTSRVNAGAIFAKEIEVRQHHKFFQHPAKLPPDERFTLIDVPGALATIVQDIDRSGERTCGIYLDSEQHVRGFFRETSGKFRRIDPPGAVDTFVQGLNDHGDLVGDYLDKRGRHLGFHRTPAGHFRRVRVGHAHEVFPEVVTDDGQILGALRLEAGGPLVGFRMFVNGTYQLIEPPSATATLVADISDGGFLLGSFIDAAGLTRIWTLDPTNGEFDEFPIFIPPLPKTRDYLDPSQPAPILFVGSTETDPPIGIVGNLLSGDVTPIAFAFEVQTSQAWAASASRQVVGTVVQVDDDHIGHGFLFQLPPTAEDEPAPPPKKYKRRRRYGWR